MALAFALFRLFDILKPWPIRLADMHFQRLWRHVRRSAGGAVCNRPH
jgi:hypothetical protein